MSHNPNAAGLAINWHIFGSSGQDKADYSRGVLERFTRRAQNDFGDPQGKNVWYTGNTYVKIAANPRRINFFGNAHFANYFENFHVVNENAEPLKISGHNCPVTTEKIVIHHYVTKSREEYAKKVQRGNADHFDNHYNIKTFDHDNRNEEFDDGILKYRAMRAKTYQPPDKSRADERLFTALTANLSPTLLPHTPPQFYAGKMETFLTCRAVAAYLKTKLTDDAPAKFFEEAALKAISRTLASNNLSVADVRLLLSELPDLLSLPYPSIKEVQRFCLNIIPQLMDIMHLNNLWKNYVELDYLQRLLKNFRE